MTQDSQERNGAPTLFTGNFILICLANLCTCMASYSVLPVLPLYLMDVMHCPKSVMGAVMAVFPLVALLFRPFSGLLVDRFNRRQVLIIATLCCAVLFPLYLTAAGVLLFTAVRFLHGVAFASMSTAQATLAVDFMPEGRIGTGIGIFSSSVSLGMIFGPMLGLFVADAVSYASAFWLPFFFTAAGALFQILLHTRRQSIPVRKKLTPDMFFMKSGVYALSALLLAAFMQGMIVNYISVLAREHGLSDYAGLFFLLMGMGLLVSRLFSGYVADHGFMVQLVCCAELVTAGGAVLVSMASSPALFVLCGAVIGMSLGALMPCYQTVLVSLASKDKRGVANSMYFIGMDGGIFLALVSGGLIADALGMAESYLAAAAGQLLALGIFLKFVAPLTASAGIRRARR